MKNFLDVIGDVTDFIIGKEIDEEPEKEKVFGVSILINILGEALKVAKIFNLRIFQCEIISYHKLLVNITCL